jgi:hypothetical protein
MLTTGQDGAEARLRRQNRYGGEARTEGEARHLLYLEVRNHFKAGWDELPEGLTQRNLRDLAAMAKARNDHRIYALCRQADLAGAALAGADSL